MLCLASRRAWFQETFAATATAADMEAYLIESYSPAIQAQEIADSRATMFLAEDRSAAGDILVGYAHLVEDHDPTSIELKRIYVDASWQGRGLAKRLLDEVVHECRRRAMDRLWLSVWHRNARRDCVLQEQRLPCLRRDAVRLG